jgi:hypothetical protein
MRVMARPFCLGPLNMTSALYTTVSLLYLGSVYIITRAHITGYSSLVLIAGNRPVDLYVTCTHICTTRLALAAAYVAVPEGAACCTQKSRWTTRAYTASTNRWLPVCGYCSSSSWVYASLEHSFLQARGYSTTMIATDQSPAFRFVAKIPVLWIRTCIPGLETWFLA